MLLVFIAGGIVLSSLVLVDGKIEPSEIDNLFTYLLIVAAFLSVEASISSLNRRLKIEQQPLVVVSIPLSVDQSPSVVPGIITVKNIGRGPALGVRVSPHRYEEKTIFDSSQPESIDLGAGDERADWTLDEQTITRLLEGKDYFNLFISYSDQLGTEYEVRTDMQLTGGYWRVVQNTRIV